MAPAKILVDSGFLYSLHNKGDIKYPQAKVLADIYTSQLLIPHVVLTEAAYLMRRTSGVFAVIRFMDSLVKSNPQFEVVTIADLIRAREIMAAYIEARLDFVDCCIMAISERLSITQVCTFDQRDFSIFRPKHCAYLEILP